MLLTCWTGGEGRGEDRLSSLELSGSGATALPAPTELLPAQHEQALCSSVFSAPPLLFALTLDKLRDRQRCERGPPGEPTVCGGGERYGRFRGVAAASFCEVIVAAGLSR